MSVSIHRKVHKKCMRAFTLLKSKNLRAFITLFIMMNGFCGQMIKINAMVMEGPGIHDTRRSLKVIY